MSFKRNLSDLRPSATTSGISGDLEDLFSYDPTTTKSSRTITKSDSLVDNNFDQETSAGFSLDVDESIKITRTRRPIAKLDESRLLSDKGIPELRRITRSKLKFKGKGHEFNDTCNLLNMYQIWLDNLYPRAKFEDGLSIINKLGRSKRLQVMRKQWIDADTPRFRHTESNSLSTVMSPELSALNPPTYISNSINLRLTDSSCTHDPILCQDSFSSNSQPDSSSKLHPNSDLDPELLELLNTETISPIGIPTKFESSADSTSLHDHDDRHAVTASSMEEFIEMDNYFDSP